MRLTLILAAAVSVVALPVLARPACSPPAGLTPAPVLSPDPDEVVSGVTNAFYLLALNWTPQWCAEGGVGASAQQMDCRRAFGFSLHGLWPNGVTRPYPRYCRPVGAIDAATVRKMFCRTPSTVLLQHEWQAHGACGFADPRAYFGQAARLYDALRLPKIEAIAPDALTAGAVRGAFVAANPAFKASAVFVQTTRAGALSEVRLCYDLAWRPAACPGGVGAPDGVHLRLAPSRTGAF
ncbi:ribonuclease T2 family protein [Phenylobacterium sp.]|uniref:ribonuclease T2 family protein n=1 Tax=Phenylobacterium sp. TaxID=1871053 RepID=UPI00286C4FB1|nr:ribonuclease [Phenylobacterium sp.]